MAKCKHCSAPLPRDSIICEYCGVRNDIELQPTINSALPTSKRMCPDCMVYLDSIDIGENSRFIVEKCKRCYGLFFDVNELETLLKQSLESSYWVNPKKLHSLLQHPLHKDTVLYRKCPVCSKIMQRKNYMGKSGVIMDMCVDHGIWLDAGELKQIQEWTALGGKHIAEEMTKIEEIKTIKMTRYKHKKQDKHYSDNGVDNNTQMLVDAVDILSNLLRW